MTKFSASALCAALLTFFAACRATPPPLASVLSESAVVLATPVIEQDELFECGLVSLSVLCAYYQIEIPALERARLARIAAEREGLSGDELRGALQGLGFDVFLFAGTCDREPTGLLRHIDLGRPVLVMTSERDSHHYSLFIGYDSERDSVVLLDPRRGRVVLPTPVFARLWQAAQRFTLLAVPRAAGAGTPHSPPALTRP